MKLQSKLTLTGSNEPVQFWQRPNWPLRLQSNSSSVLQS